MTGLHRIYWLSVNVVLVKEGRNSYHELESDAIHQQSFEEAPEEIES